MKRKTLFIQLRLLIFEISPRNIRFLKGTVMPAIRLRRARPTGTFQTWSPNFSHSMMKIKIMLDVNYSQYHVVYIQTSKRKSRANHDLSYTRQCNDPLPQSGQTIIEGVPPIHEDLGTHCVIRNSIHVKSFFTPLALHRLYYIGIVSPSSCERPFPRLLFNAHQNVAGRPGLWIGILTGVAEYSQRGRNHRVPDRVSMLDMVPSVSNSDP
jgi:hypothetical protein